MARPKVDSKNLRTHRFVFKLSKNQINILKGKTNAKLVLKTLNSLFVKAMQSKQSKDIQSFIENMLKNT